MLFFLILIQMVEFPPFGKINYVISEYCVFVGGFRRGGFNTKEKKGYNNRKKTNRLLIEQ